MKKYIISLLFVFTGAQLFAQIAGISGSKTRSYCVGIVSPKHVEFEPAFY